MKWVPMVWAALWRKPARTVLTALSITTAFLLFGALHGTMASFDELLDRMLDGSELITVSRVSPGAPLPLAYLPRIQRVDGVEGVQFQQGFDAYYQNRENHFGGIAIVVAQMRENPDPRIVVSDEQLETLERTRTGAIVGRQLADRWGWRIGDRLPIKSGVVRTDRSNDWVFDIVGIWDVSSDSTFGADQIWINYDYFDEARALENGTVNGFLVRISSPDQAARVALSIDRLFANSSDETQTQTFAAFIREEINRIMDVRLIINAVLSAVFFTLLFVTGNTMMQSVRERTPEIAVLKTYGYTDAIVGGLVLSEASLLCVTSALLGLVVAGKTLLPLIFSAFGIDPIPMEPNVFSTGATLAVGLAFVSALVPALRARRLNVVDALARG